MTTFSKKPRRNRPDGRPNDKVRQIINKSIDKKQSIQDIRVTRTLKGSKKEREVTKLQLKKTDNREKIMKSLRKKMKSIEQLLQRQKSGDILDEQQLAKIGNLDSVVARMDEFLKEN
jgi:uncharacterized protein with WD repeat